MSERLVIGWLLLALIALGTISAVWLAGTHRKRKRRRERRDAVRSAAHMASRGTLSDDRT